MSGPHAAPTYMSRSGQSLKPAHIGLLDTARQELTVLSSTTQSSTVFMISMTTCDLGQARPVMSGTVLAHTVPFEIFRANRLHR